MRPRISGVAVCAAALLSLLPRPVAAQRGTGSIAGTVRDTTGAVLPGATVEAASPALIEKVRSAVTDDTGQYKLVELRPGVYTVTVTLPGFRSVRREGIELTSDFTASVNAELRVGSVEETITVLGASPVVDVQNVVQQRVFTREVLDSVPTGKYYQNIVPPGRMYLARVNQFDLRNGQGLQTGWNAGPRHDRFVQRLQRQHRGHREPVVRNDRGVVAGAAGHHAGTADQVRRAAEFLNVAQGLPRWRRCRS
jgi:hypothetical protein